MHSNSTDIGVQSAVSQLWQFVVNDTFADSISAASIVDLVDWQTELKFLLKDFLNDVFEGQKITSVGIFCFVSLLFIKEYIVLNTQMGPDGRPILQPEDGEELVEQVIVDGPEAVVEGMDRLEAPQAVEEEEEAPVENRNDFVQEQPNNGDIQPIQHPDNQPREDNAINFNINLEFNDGNIVAEVNANGDVNAFLELVGVRGSLKNFAANLFVIHFVVLIMLYIGVWFPRFIGKFVVWIWQDYYTPALEWAIQIVSKLMYRITDPLLDPLVDGFFAISEMIPADLVETVSTFVAPLVSTGTLSSRSSIFPDNKTNHGVDSVGGLSAINVSLIVSNKNSSYLESVDWEKAISTVVQDDLFLTITGYLTLSLLFTYYANTTGLTRHPYAQTAKMLLKSLFKHFLLVGKITFFIGMELGVFPVFCGSLVHISFFPVFERTITFVSRHQFYKIHPNITLFVHWLVGMTAMFQFAMLASNVRQVLRPGVMWFLRDPNDPNFNPMNEIIEKPFLFQLRKLATGFILYTCLVFGIVGGSILGILGLQVLFRYYSGSGVFKIFPLRWEFGDQFSDFPFDLLLLHFLRPPFLKLLKPKELFVFFLENLFLILAKWLRLTSFLFGGEHPDEESDFEDNEADDHANRKTHLDIRYETILNPLAGSTSLLQREKITSELVLENGETVPILGNDDDEWEDELSPSKVEMNTESQESGNASDKPAKRLRYMRVPNRDQTEIKPKERMMIFMGEDDPVFGRPGETKEEVMINWTKVYVPDNFWRRIFILFFMLWASLDMLIVSVFTIPLIVGRIAMAWLVTLTTVTIDVPAEYNYKVPPHSARTDLVVHDFYSYVCGFVIAVAVAYPIYALRRMIKRLTRLGRRNATRQRRRQNNRDVAGAIRRGRVGGLVGAPEVEEEDQTAAEERLDSVSEAEQPEDNASQRVLRYFRRLFRRLSKMSVKAFKLLYLVILAIVLPTIYGLIVDIYIFTQLKGYTECTNILFFVQDWCTGVLFMKFAYNIILVGPETDVSRNLRALVRSGLKYDPRFLTFMIAMPTIAAGVILLPLPIFGLYFESILGISTVVAREYLLQCTIYVVAVLFTVYEIITSTYKFFTRVISQIRDEQYLVGRRLHNIDELDAAIPI